MTEKLQTSELDTIMEDLDAPGAGENPLDEDGPEVNQAPPKRGAKRAKAKVVAGMTVSQLEARVKELEAQTETQAIENAALAKRAASVPEPLPDDPKAMVKVRIPLTATGVPVSRNGKKYQGLMTITREEYTWCLGKLGANAQIQVELTQKRGTEISMNQLAAQDTGSRLQKRRQGRHVVSCG